MVVCHRCRAVVDTLPASVRVHIISSRRVRDQFDDYVHLPAMRFVSAVADHGTELYRARVFHVPSTTNNIVIFNHNNIEHAVRHIRKSTGINWLLLFVLGQHKKPFVIFDHECVCVWRVRWLRTTNAIHTSTLMSAPNCIPMCNDHILSAFIRHGMIFPSFVDLSSDNDDD